MAKQYSREQILEKVRSVLPSEFREHIGVLPEGKVVVVFDFKEMYRIATHNLMLNELDAIEWVQDTFKACHDALNDIREDDIAILCDKNAVEVIDPDEVDEAITPMNDRDFDPVYGLNEN
jgi:hypothetical protein